MQKNTGEATYNPDNLSQAHLWSLALAGILVEANSERHDLLYGSIPTDAGRENIRNVMERDWGIRTREDLYQMLDEFPGHNPTFLGMRNYLEALSVSARSEYIVSQQKRNHNEYVRLSIVNNSLGRWSRQGIIAWDKGRMVMLCRWGALIGLHTDEEAWGHIMQAAKIVQPAYKDWYDYGWHYLVGRQFWQASLSVHHSNLQMSWMKRLLQEDSGIWRKLPWEADLNG